MRKFGFMVFTTMFLLALPLAAVALDIRAQVYENGSQNVPVAVPGVAFSVFGGSGGKTLLSSGVSGGDGTCKLSNVPAGAQVVVKLTKDGYETQYDVRSYSEADAGAGVVLWVGSQANIKSLYKNLGLAFDAAKGQVYLEVVDELTGDGIGGIQLGSSSGQAFDLGQGDYLIANAAGSSVQVTFAKAGYAFDTEAATIPLYAGAITQYYAASSQTKEPKITSFTANPKSITSGQSSTLSWRLSGGTPTTLTIDNGPGSVLGQSSVVVSPSATTTYTLLASNSAGTVSKSVTVTVKSPQTKPTQIKPGTYTVTGTMTISGGQCCIDQYCSPPLNESETINVSIQVSSGSSSTQYQQICTDMNSNATLTATGVIDMSCSSSESCAQSLTATSISFSGQFTCTAQLASPPAGETCSPMVFNYTWTGTLETSASAAK